MPLTEREDQNIALVVDDSPESLSMITTALEDNGISVIVANNGHAAIKLAQRILPDVILMDAMMPELDGFETCRLLKENDQLAYAPVIFMTGLSESEHIIKGLQVGGVDYVTKPAVVDELIARITTHILNARAIQSARQALDASGRSIIAVDTDTRILWGSPNAFELLGRKPAGMRLSDFFSSDFENWLRGCVRLPTSQASTYTSDGLAICFVGTSPSDEVLLKVRVNNQSNPYELLSGSFGLTPREAEVLFWISMGKTNRDIAEILELSSRTINKHLEQVFQKMGVDNRTSAAVAADRIINAPES